MNWFDRLHFLANLFSEAVSLCQLRDSSDFGKIAMNLIKLVQEYKDAPDALTKEHILLDIKAILPDFKKALAEMGLDIELLIAA